MKDAIRVVLVDPIEESREPLLSALERLEGVWLAEVCVFYSVAAGRVAELEPDVVLLVCDADPEQTAELIRTIQREAPDVIVLAAGERQASSGVLTMIRAGAREFISLPASDRDLLEVLVHLTQPAPAEALPSPSPSVSPSPSPSPIPEGSAHVIAVTGAAGEVGSTSLAVNLATTLARTSGQEVVLVDFDLLFGSIDAMLDIVPENSIHEVVQSLDRIDPTLLKRMLPRHSSGLYVLPRPSELEDAGELDPETLRHALALLKTAFPIVVIDTSKNVQASDLIAFEAADVILLVVQLESTCVRNAVRFVECFRQFENLAARIQVVANRVGSARSTVSIETAELALQTPIVWKVPNATKVFHTARDKGVALDVVSGRNDAVRVIAEMSRVLVPAGALRSPKARRGLFRDRL